MHSSGATPLISQSAGRACMIKESLAANTGGAVDDGLKSLCDGLMIVWRVNDCVAG